MKTSTVVGLRSLSVAAITACLALTTPLPGLTGVALAQPPTLEGAWAVVITLVNCTTKQPIGAPPFRTLLTFHRDGTSSESVGTTSFAPGQRSNGHGTWSHDGGLTYKEKTVAMILFEANSFLAGWQVINRHITMTDADHYSGYGPSEFYDLNGQVYRTACAASVGERIK